MSKSSHKHAAATPRAETTVWHSDFGSDVIPRFSADQHVGTALRETFRCFAKALSAKIEPFGLTLNMWFVLRALWENDGLSQFELAKRLEVTPAAMVGLVNSLHDLGLVIRCPSPTDRRAVRVHLTSQGRALRGRATGQALQVDARALRGLSPVEVEMMLKLMAILRKNLAGR